MHRHGYQGRKFGRERDQRRALLKSLAESLIVYESIETTLPKAKELVPYVEQLITKAKVGDLHGRRQVLAGLQTVASAHKLVDELAPKMKRSSGHLRIVRNESTRRGDNAIMARVSFVDNLKEAPVSKSVASSVKTTNSVKKPASTTTKPVAKTAVKKTAGAKA